MVRNTLRRIAGGVGLLLGVAGVGVWRWKRRRLDGLAAGSELVVTDRGVIEVARRGSGYPVVVLHGSPGGYDQGLFVGEVAFGEGFEVIAPSRPGFLRTPLVDGGSPGEQAALLVAMLDELGVEEALFVGFSAGGPYALQVAAEYPERVSGLVLASAVTTEYDERTFDTGNPPVDAVVTSTPYLDVGSALVALTVASNPDRAVEMTHQQLSTLQGERLQEYVDYVATRPDQRARALSFASTIYPASARLEGTRNDERWARRLPAVDYGQVECPVLAIYGEYDALVPAAHAEFVAERVPDAELLRVEADHLVLVGPDAERVRRELRAFGGRIASSTEPPAR